MNEFDYLEETTPYKKKSKARPPKKSKHKHDYQPCILSYPEDWWNKTHLRNRKMKDVISAYCPVCGKLGDIQDRSVWYKRETVFINNIQFTESVLTNEGEKQMNKRTRTLPTFIVEDPFAKFVSLNVKEDA